MKRVLLFVVLAIIALFAVLLVRTWTVESRQIAAAPVPAPALDRAAVLERFSLAVRLRMVSSEWVTGSPFIECGRSGFIGR